MNKKLLNQLQNEMNCIKPSNAWVSETRQELLFFASNHQARTAARKWFYWPALALTFVLLISVAMGGLIFYSKPGQFLYQVKQFIQSVLDSATPPSAQVKGYYTPALHAPFSADTFDRFLQEDPMQNNVQGASSSAYSDVPDEATVSGMPQVTPVASVIPEPNNPPSQPNDSAQEKENNKDKQKHEDAPLKEPFDTRSTDRKSQKDK